MLLLLFGEHDAYAVLDPPDDESGAAASIAANMAGAAKVTVTKLLTAEQVVERGAAPEADRVDTGRLAWSQL